VVAGLNAIGGDADGSGLGVNHWLAAMRVRHSAIMRGRGLDHDGFIEREGDLARVPQAFGPVVAAAKAAILRAFGTGRLHGAYLYGSVPRGTAVPGVSDLGRLACAA
jgi:hypothetical protein